MFCSKKKKNRIHVVYFPLIHCEYIMFHYTGTPLESMKDQSVICYLYRFGDNYICTQITNCKYVMQRNISVDNVDIMPKSFKEHSNFFGFVFLANGEVLSGFFVLLYFDLLCLLYVWS